MSCIVIPYHTLHKTPFHFISFAMRSSCLCRSSFIFHPPLYVFSLFCSLVCFSVSCPLVVDVVVSLLFVYRCVMRSMCSSFNISFSFFSPPLVSCIHGFWFVSCFLLLTSLLCSAFNTFCVVLRTVFLELHLFKCHSSLLLSYMSVPIVMPACVQKTSQSS